MRRQIPGLVRFLAILPLVLGSACSGVRLAASEVSPIAWRADYARAMAEARARNRPVWIQFTGPWCPWCVRMEHDTFPHPGVVALAREAVVPVLLRADVDEDVALRYGLAGLPATLLVNAQGEVLAKHEGYLDAATFQSYVVGTLDRYGLYRRAQEPTQAAPELALDGYCPVSLVAEHRLVPGKKSVVLCHDSRLFRFASNDAQARFRKQPELYMPVNAGRCPVRQVDDAQTRPGSPRFGALYEGHLYLCSDEPARRRFVDHPERYAHVDVADRGFCPHCWARESLVVRGRAEHSLTRAGQRFFFPDAVHLEAFRATSDSLRR